MRYHSYVKVKGFVWVRVLGKAVHHGKVVCIVASPGGGGGQVLPIDPYRRWRRALQPPVKENI